MEQLAIICLAVGGIVGFFVGWFVFGSNYGDF